MPRYFFDVADGRPHRDDEGHDCLNDKAARLEALETLTSIAADAGRHGCDEQGLTIHVRDEAGNPVYKATLTCLGQMLRN